MVVGGGSASYLGASIEMRGHAAGIPWILIIARWNSRKITAR